MKKIFTKRCSKCRSYRPQTSYHMDKNRSNGRYPQCNSCVKKYQEVWRSKNKKKIKSDQSEWYKKNKEKKKLYYQAHKVRIARNKRSHKLRSIYGITLEKYDNMFKKQNGKCAICSKKQDIHLGVDHNHFTKQVRGLLCRECNLGLGHFMDSIKLLASARKYMEKYS